MIKQYVVRAQEKAISLWRLHCDRLYRVNFFLIDNDLLRRAESLLREIIYKINRELQEYLSSLGKRIDYIRHCGKSSMYLLNVKLIIFTQP